jgi:hypothetical protein
MYVIRAKSIVDEIVWVLNTMKEKLAFLTAPNNLQKFTIDKNKVSW